MVIRSPDIDQALETALEDFEGALVVISHDRYFLDRVVDRTAELEDGSLRQFEGMACFIKVSHEANPEDIEHPFSRVVGYYRDRKEVAGASAPAPRRR